MFSSDEISSGPKSIQTFYHGKPQPDKKKFQAGFYFHIFPSDVIINQPQWEFHQDPCKEKQFVGPSKENGKLYICRGHNTNVENAYFHGKSMQGNNLYPYGFYFRVNPISQKLRDPDMDFYFSPCNNARLLEDLGETKLFRCYGHKYKHPEIYDPCVDEIIPSTTKDRNYAEFII